MREKGSMAATRRRDIPVRKWENIPGPSSQAENRVDMKYCLASLLCVSLSYIVKVSCMAFNREMSLIL